MNDVEQKQIGEVYEILRSMQQSMITKEDAKSFLTKEDAKSFATKDDILAMQEDIEFLKENMASKEDLADFKSEVIEHIDGFARQNQKFDLELVAAQAKFNRVEKRVEVLELKVGIAA